MTLLTPFQSILGPNMDGLADTVRAYHSLTKEQFTSGTADITAASGFGPWFIGWFAGLPRPGRDVPVAVSFHPDGQGREHWKRQFATRRYDSIMEAGQGRDDGLLIEHFGMFDLLFALTPEGNGLQWSLKKWRWLGIPLPAWSKPTIECLETGEGRHFRFDIDVAFPLVGHVLHYKGRLATRD